MALHKVILLGAGGMVLFLNASSSYHSSTGLGEGTNNFVEHLALKLIPLSAL